MKRLIRFTICMVTVVGSVASAAAQDTSPIYHYTEGESSNLKKLEGKHYWDLMAVCAGVLSAARESGKTDPSLKGNMPLIDEVYQEAFSLSVQTLMRYDKLSFESASKKALDRLAVVRDSFMPIDERSAGEFAVMCFELDEITGRNLGFVVERFGKK